MESITHNGIRYIQVSALTIENGRQTVWLRRLAGRRFYTAFKRDGVVEWVSSFSSSTPGFGAS